MVLPPLIFSSAVMLLCQPSGLYDHFFSVCTVVCSSSSLFQKLAILRTSCSEPPPPPSLCQNRETHTNRHKHAHTHTSSDPPSSLSQLQLLISSVQAAACLSVCVCVCVWMRGDRQSVCVSVCTSMCERVVVCEGREIGVKYSHRGCLSSSPSLSGCGQ